MLISGGKIPALNMFITLHFLLLFIPGSSLFTRVFGKGWMGEKSVEWFYLFIFHFFYS